MAFLSLSQTQPPSSSPSHHQVETQISQTQALWFFSFLILMIDRSWNPNPFKQKPKVDRSESWSNPFKPKSTPTKRTNKEWMRKEEVDQTHWSRLKRRGQRRGPIKSEWEKKRLIRPIEAGWKEEVDEEVDQTHWSREWMRSEREGKKK